MHLLSEKTLLSQTSIPVILQWWLRRKRLAKSRNVLSNPVVKNVDSNYLDKYQRLMDVYAVVKSGGAVAQIQAANEYRDRERDAITRRLSQISNQPEATDEYLRLQQEAQELESSTLWRINQLKDIHPEEERAVREYLPQIEQVLIR
ncbi:hypothetical protein D0962_35410 [Leptolyngbyaceae cyanobacterium CCMR0082]|uniref:Uncharacterized protein n=1 Tax=Adonisia turfae CCMR0082 TaxID=2304604 RepID=A0A6M0SHE3_9CYAN|nr:hypothetical protein [Adonisia turfae]MDV3350836.1 hypothetical protein [Leptothoe sp. LEGE 181152]NEZ67968.1 hypothetical protein [Adonisia turfae CCMR0082]